MQARHAAPRLVQNSSMSLSLSDFDYELPAELIAQFPAPQRRGSRLLRVRGDTLDDHRFAELPSLLLPGDLLVFNDTRVIKARLTGTKASGGKVEVLIERVLDAHTALAQVRARHAPVAGMFLTLGSGISARVEARDHVLFRLRFDCDEPLDELLELEGALPLPPYITRLPDALDEARYQTVYARAPGAVAAPTAGLHFDEAMFDALEACGIAHTFVTLHVGAGTFQPVRSEDLATHRMHGELFQIPAGTVEAIRAARGAGGRIVCVGTTSLRALESAAIDGDARGEPVAGAGETELFITPGFRFRVADFLLTNFHLPKSTLYMLACAFGGMQAMRAAYAHAIRERYRFFSYGDCMLIERQSTPDAVP
jgi:S-adenosylmethionine:tRNA ribosyltransferase-isomerase